MKFLIVDNRSLFRHGLTALLKAKFDTATFDHAMDEEDAFLSLNRLSYTLIFISAKRDNIKTLCFIRQVTERWPNTKLIAILAAKNIIAAPSIYSAGARGIFDEKTNIEEISIGIEAVLLNKSYIDIQMIDVIM
jgi:DNA-binding NarL/FixJ family response regulator